MKRFFIFLASLFLLAGAFVCAFLFVGFPEQTKNQHYGVTFSSPYANSLGLNAQEALRTAIQDIGIRRFRIPVYWSTIEPEKDKWDFSDIDWQLEQLRASSSTAILTVGRKQPRWPECWIPTWAKSMSFDEQESHILVAMQKTVERYKDHSEVGQWQVENEPLLPFGDCRMPSIASVLSEIRFVHALDPSRPISSTESGEFALWAGLGSIVDRLGVSVYRTVQNPIIGNVNIHYWFVPPFAYHRKAELVKPFGVKDVYVSEFQMEPWSNTSIPDTPIDKQMYSFDLDQMKSNFEFASKSSISEVYFWGVEWWIWMAEQGRPEFLDLARKMWRP